LYATIPWILEFSHLRVIEAGIQQKLSIRRKPQGIRRLKNLLCNNQKSCIYKIQFCEVLIILFIDEKSSKQMNEDKKTASLDE
jgi:hypothetical protein